MLERRGVEVRLRAPVTAVGPASVTLADGNEIPTGMVVWATGVRAPRLADSLGLPQAPDGRVFVEPNPSLPGHPEAFVIGDMAALLAQGRPAPTAGQVRHPGRTPRRARSSGNSRRARAPFRYWNKGITASVGRDAGVVQAGRIRFSGRLAFFAWAPCTASTCPAGGTGSAST